MSCIFKKSRYYRDAKLQAVDVVEPLSYEFLNKESEVKKSRPIAKNGKTISRFLMDTSLVRHISSLKTHRSELQRSLKVNQATRKNSYMSGTNIEHFSKKSTKEMLGQISHNFFKNQGKDEMMRFLQLSFCLFGRDNAFPIKDYALSTYTIYFNCSNKLIYNAIEEHIQQQFLQYEHNILIDNSLIARPQLRQPTRYDSLSAAKQYIQQINQIGSRDPFYSGVHLYINDLIPNENSNPGEYANEEKQFLPFLQFHIFVALSVLADGQSAIIRVRGTFTQKTSQMIYLLKLCFHRINFVKNIFSNPLTHDKYVICEGFIKQYSNSVLSHMQHNFHLLFQDEKWLLVDARVLVVSEFQKNIHTYNDLSPIMKSKQLHNVYNESQCLAIFPNKKAALQKASQLKIPRVQYYVEQLQAMIPDAEQKEEVKTSKIVQKQGIAIDFDLLGLSLDNQTKKIDYFDISQKKKEQYDANIEKYILQGNKTIEQKKQKKKIKKDKEEEQ